MASSSTKKGEVVGFTLDNINEKWLALIFCLFVVVFFFFLGGSWKWGGGGGGGGSAYFLRGELETQGETMHMCLP